MNIFPIPDDAAGLQRLAEQLAEHLEAVRRRQHEARRLTLRQARAAMVLPAWMSQPPNDVSLRRLLDGLPAEQLDGNWMPAVPGLGDRFLDDVRGGDIRALGEAIRDRVGLQLVARSRRHGRPLASYRADDHGHGAQRTFLEVAKRFYSEAVTDGLTPQNPALKLPKPGKQRLVRGLTQEEENIFQDWITHRRRDPELDLLLVDYFIRTAVRKEGVLGLTRDSQSLRSCAITAFQKGAKPHRVPLARSVIERALALAAERGATAPGDLLWRTATGQPVTSRHLDQLFAAARLERIFGEHLPVSTHWLRHTSTARIQAVSRHAVVPSYWLNHSLSGFGVTGPYLKKPTWDDLCAAAEAAWGPLRDRPAPT